MKILCYVSAFVVLAGVLSAGTTRGAGPDLRQWSQAAAVELTAPPAKGLVEVPLGPEVFAVSRADLGDLRVATKAGEAVAYVTRVDQGEPPRSVSYEPSRMFNATYVPKVQSTVMVDFGRAATRTRVDVETPGTNFRRRVMVEAGSDGETWQVLRKSAWLFRISADGSNYSKTEVPLPDNDFRYLRITVFNAPDDPERVAVSKVQAWFIKAAPPRTIDVPLRATTVTENAKLGATEIEVDLGYENLPVHEAALAFEDANFLRRVEVLGRNFRSRTVMEPVENSQPRKREVEEPWTSVGGGTVWRFPAAGGEGQEAAGLSLGLAGQNRYLLFRIYNGDDKALKFSGVRVSRLPYYLAFSAANPGPYTLFTGNSEATRPQYDLEHFVDRLRGEGVTAGTLGPLGANPLYAVAGKAAAWSERYAWALWIVLIAVGVVLGGLVLRQARRTAPAG